MNSWGSLKLERRIDHLLRQSVERGSEPENILVKLPPMKPRFPWIRIAWILGATFLLGFFALQFLHGSSLTSADYEGFFGSLTLSTLIAGITWGKALSAAAITVGLAGTIMAFLPDWNGTLHRLL